MGGEGKASKSNLSKGPEVSDDATDKEWTRADNDEDKRPSLALTPSRRHRSGRQSVHSDQCETMQSCGHCVSQKRVCSGGSMPHCSSATGTESVNVRHRGSPTNKLHWLIFFTIIRFFYRQITRWPRHDSRCLHKPRMSHCRFSYPYFR